VTSCAPTGNGVGIDATGHNNIKVADGTIQGMGNVGIIAGYNCIIEDVRVISNGGDGIFIVFEDGTVSGNIAIGNATLGISVSYDGTVSGNTAIGNGYDGFFVGGGTVSGNTANYNGSGGYGYGLEFHSGTPAGYLDNVFNENTSGNVINGINLGHNLCGTVLCP